MSATTIIKRSDGSKAQIGQLAIPDLWHLHQQLAERSQEIKAQGEEGDSFLAALCARQSVEVLEAWHLLHDLKKHIEETE